MSIGKLIILPGFAKFYTSNHCTEQKATAIFQRLPFDIASYGGDFVERELGGRISIVAVEAWEGAMPYQTKCSAYQFDTAAKSQQ